MSKEKVCNLLTTIESIKSARFYPVNAWGIISFKSDISYTASRNATAFMNGELSSKEAIEFVKELNDAIKPVLQKYKVIAQGQLAKEYNEQLKTIENE